MKIQYIFLILLSLLFLLKKKKKDTNIPSNDNVSQQDTSVSLGGIMPPTTQSDFSPLPNPDTHIKVPPNNVFTTSDGLQLTEYNNC